MAEQDVDMPSNGASTDEEQMLLNLAGGTDVASIQKLLHKPFNEAILNEALEQACTAMVQLEQQMEQRFEICSYLLTAGARILPATDNQASSSLFHYCCFYGNIRLLQQVLDAVLVLQPEQQNDMLNRKHAVSQGSKETPLLHALIRQHFDCVEAMIRFCEKWCMVIINHCFQTVCKRGDSASLEQLLKYCNTYTIHDLLPVGIITAVQSKHIECVKILVKSCTNLNQFMFFTKNIDEWELILSQAILCSHSSLSLLPVSMAYMNKWPCVTYMLQDKYIHHYDLNACHINDGFTLLGYIISKHKLSVLKQLLAFDINTNKQYSKRIPIMHAMAQYMKHRTVVKWKIIRLLIIYGCELNAALNRIKQRWTVPPHPELLEISLLAGANVSLVHGINIKYHADKKLIDTFVVNKGEKTPLLKHLTRLSIRDALGTNIPGKIRGLMGMIPSILLDYLELPEINDIEVRYSVSQHFSGDAEVDFY